MKKKIAWILCMIGLCLVLYTVVVSRMESSTNVIFGGAEGAYVKSDSVTFMDMNATPTPEPTVDIWPQLTQSDFEENNYLRIVNNDNLISSAFEPTSVARISSTRYMMFDAEYLPYLDAFIEAIKEAGFDVYVAGAYRSYSYQNRLFNSKASQIAYEKAGGRDVDYTDPIYQEAVEEAKLITAFPGSSEHQLGLAVDLLDKNYSRMVYSEMNQEFFAWLDEHCAEYGFIKRYPTRKLLLTGWDEPWHYRYVGKEAATFIMEQGICFEEFYAHYFPDFQY